MQHFLQTEYWAKVREKHGHIPYWVNNTLVLVKKLPSPWKSFGYIPQPDYLTINFDDLKKFAKEKNLSHIQIDPDNLIPDDEPGNGRGRVPNIKQATAKTDELYLRHSLLLDLTKSEEELLADMKKKHRYNIKVAEQRGVDVLIRDDEEALDIAIDLILSNAKKQKYFARDVQYYKDLYSVLKPEGKIQIALAKYQNKYLVGWILFVHGDTIYYPYGGSSELHRDVMPAYKLVWGIMRWGKQNGYKKLDLWGIEPKDIESNQGFSRFKVGFGGTIVNYQPSFDVIYQPIFYWAFKAANKGRWAMLKIRKLFL